MHIILQIAQLLCRQQAIFLNHSIHVTLRYHKENHVSNTLYFSDLSVRVTLNSGWFIVSGWVKINGEQFIIRKY